MVGAVVDGDAAGGGGTGCPPAGLLTAAEQQAYAGLKFAKRRQEWLLGRWTAKQLLRQVIWQETGQALALDSLGVVANGRGAPCLQVSGVAALLPEAGYQLSISHAHGRAFCAVVAGRYGPLGADIEWIAPRPAGFAADYFTTDELALLEEAPAGMYDTLVTAVWSGKEAAMKVAQVGLRVDTRTVSCDLSRPGVAPQTWTYFPIHWANGQTMAGWWQVQDNYVLALAIAIPGRVLHRKTQQTTRRTLHAEVNL